MMKKNLKWLPIIMTFFLVSSRTASAQWIQLGCLCHAAISTFVVSGDNIYIASNGYLSLSTNNGASCTMVDSGLPDNFSGIHYIAVSGDSIFATADGGVFLSTDNGKSWTAVNSGLPVSARVNCLAVSGSNIFAGTGGYGVFLSTNNGTSWTAVNSGLPANAGIGCFAVSGGSIFVGTTVIPGGGVFLSTNNGTSWTAVNSGLPANTSVYSLAVSGTNIVAGTGDGGVFLSTNSGTSWTAVNSGLPANAVVTSLAVSGGNIFAGIMNSSVNSGVYLSTDNGKSWTAVDSVSKGPPMGGVFVLVISGNDIFAGTDNWGIFRRPLSEMVSVIPQNQQSTPLQTGLRIAASGALRSEVMLNYSIQSRCIVHMGIYTISGKQVAILEQGQREPGEYTVKFDNNKIPSGLYVCRFQAGSYQARNRMIVTK